MADSTSSGLSSRLARLNPFKSKAKREEDDEDIGQEIDANTLAGGGHSAFQTDITLHRLRVSEALKSFLSHEGVSSEGDTEGLSALLDKPMVSPPAHLIDRSHPLPEYFVSSSHNTYLMAHQLYGTSSAAAYETTLRAGARCIEIDAWDNPDDPREPKVTHGYTLVSNIPFRAVCETVRDVVDLEAAAPPVQGYAPAPILVSLENHCNRDGQIRLIQIMKEVWGDRLLSEPVRKKGHEEQEGGEPVTLNDLGSKIAVIVEYHLPEEADDSSDSSDSSSSSDSDEEKQARKEYKAKKRATSPPIIVPELAQLGVYAQSVKPRDTSWFTEGKIKDGPPRHHLVNVSESGLAPHITEHAVKIAQHNARHLMRVFPKGTRISSQNLSPIQFWAVGAQICALNWQTFGASMQLNDALFAGTAGYVLKPAALRSGGSGASSAHARRRSLRLRVAGATDIPLPEGRDVDDVKPYLTCTLLQPGTGTDPIKVKRKTAPYHKRTALALPFLGLGRGERENPEQTEPVWDETLEWDFLD
ncbi:PLC-like phosphodiesterase, partial [Parathielavia appendiculata]